MMVADEPADLKTLRSMAALAGKQVYELHHGLSGVVTAAYIGPSFDESVWCYAVSAMPLTDKVGLFELAWDQFMNWEGFYRRYSPFMLQDEWRKIDSNSQTHRAGIMPSFPVDPTSNPMSLLHQGLRRR